VKRFVLLFLGLAAAVGMFWAATTAAVLIAGAQPVLHHADAIVVLGAAQYNGRPSPVLKARLDHALGRSDGAAAGVSST
jgi:hypothetical protein